MDVLMLMHFPVHMRMSVRMDVRVDFGIDFWGERRPSLAEQELLLRQVLLIVHGAHTVFLRAGRRRYAAPVPLSVWQPVRALQYLCRRLRHRSAGRRTMFSALAEPQQHRAKDEHYPSRYANDDRPGEGAGGWREYGCDGRFCVWKRRCQRMRRIITKSQLFNQNQNPILLPKSEP